MDKDPIQVHFETNGNASVSSYGRTGNGGGSGLSVRKSITFRQKDYLPKETDRLSRDAKQQARI